MKLRIISLEPGKLIKIKKFIRHIEDMELKMTVWGRILRKKTEDLHFKKSAEENRQSLVRAMGALDLTALGVGAIIGTGIFVLTGVASADYAGPAVIISFTISGMAAGLAALCYAELASMVPVAGSAYTYTYAALGEIIAWLIGWNIILEYLVAAGAVAIGWSSYFNDFLKSLNLSLPRMLTSSGSDGGIINLTAILITLIITLIAIKGTRDSVKATKIIVALKLTVVLLFIAVGAFNITPGNWKPFAPFGFTGIMHAAAIVFFAYIGFDAVAAAAEEVKNPSRDLPRGIIGSLIISTVLYILVSGVLTGMLKYTELNTPSPITSALLATGIRWATAFVSVGALAGLTSVLLAVIFAQSRVFFAMSRDGLLPPVFSKVHSRFRTPYINTLIVGIAVSLTAAFLPIDFLAQMANIGTLSALAVVSLGVIVLRKTQPDLKRPFRVPWVPFLPFLSICFSVYLMANLPLITWIRFFLWIIIGLIVYFFYGISHSKLEKTGNTSFPDYNRQNS